MERAGDSSTGSRAVVYCVVPAGLEWLHELLRRHFRDDPSVEVIVERRGLDRRAETERRTGRVGDSGMERRLIRSLEGRRVGERRAPLVAVSGGGLPRRARAYADQIVFIERIEPSGRAVEDSDSARLVARIQAGDRDAFAVLYLRYFDRVYGYLKAILRDRRDAEDAAQEVFTNVYRALPRYEMRGRPFRAWLFVIARNVALHHLKGVHQRSVPVAPDEVIRQTDAHLRVDSQDVWALGWIADRELMFLIERLPLAQRQVIAMRFMLGFSHAETAKLLERTPEAVRMLQSRALSFLRVRLTALGHAPERHERVRLRVRAPQSRVLCVRRFSLAAPGPTG